MFRLVQTPADRENKNIMVDTFYSKKLFSENDIRTVKPELEYSNTLKTQVDAVVHFIQRLDIEMIIVILGDNRRYQDMEKE
jgi:hypothetical protein